MIEETINEVIDNVLSLQAGRAIKLLHPVFEAHPSLKDAEEYKNIVVDYKLMLEYMRRGYDDPQRDKVYIRLLQRLYRVASDLELAWKCKNVPFYVEAYRTADHLNMSQDFVRTVLETFVSDVAMLSLKPEAERKHEGEELYRRHQTFVERLFSSLVTACQWHKEDFVFWRDLVLSPTIDSTDAQLIVTAVTISLMNRFDINKMHMLMSVYERSADVRTAQRALVGWAFSIGEPTDIFPEQRELIDKMCSKPQVTKELLELQKQFFYCLNAEADNRKIQEDIMPDIISNSNLHMTRNGIEEKEDDMMQDILHPDAADENIEKLETSMKKMMDMQQQGSDIYFGGFSQMKRFPFFNHVVNWFTPFYVENPDLNAANNDDTVSKFLEILFSQGAFCESDKYSLAFAMMTVIQRMPSNLREMVTNVESLGPVMSNEERGSKAYVRRMYLQDLYRFFRLHKNHDKAEDPFNTLSENGIIPEGFFFMSEMLLQTGIDSRRSELAMFLLRQKRYDELHNLLQTFGEEQRNTADYNNMMGYSLLHEGLPENAVQCFEKAIEIDPESKTSYRGMARAAMASEFYEEAAEAYGKLLETEPDRRSYLINCSIALVESGQVDEAAALIYKADYTYPNDMAVLRVMAWIHLYQGKLEKALEEYSTLIDKAATSDDFLNLGYCHWLMKDIEGAEEAFKEYAKLTSVDTLARELTNDTDFLKERGLTEEDIMLMQELVESNDDLPDAYGEEM